MEDWKAIAYYHCFGDCGYEFTYQDGEWYERDVEGDHTSDWVHAVEVNEEWGGVSLLFGDVKVDTADLILTNWGR